MVKVGYYPDARYYGLQYNLQLGIYPVGHSYIPCNCVFKAMHMNVYLNTRTTGTEVYLMKNDVETDLAIAVEAGQTGHLSVEADVPFLKDDRVNLKVVGHDTNYIYWFPTYLVKI